MGSKVKVKVNSARESLARIEPSERILLLPHCLRRSDGCQGTYNKDGLQCQECNPDCPINHLRESAIRLGYKGVCIAPGGVLAVRYVKENKPKGIVAIACQKELEEGVDGVKKLAGELVEIPLMVIIPLSKDGCVDTEVDENLALETIGLGCE